MFQGKGIFLWNPDDLKSERIILYQSNSIISSLSVNLVESNQGDTKIEIYFVEEVTDKQLLRDEEMKGIDGKGKQSYLRKIVICGILEQALQNVQNPKKGICIF